ncbi:phosphotransferase [Actinopolymorpha pittospori]
MAAEHHLAGGHVNTVVRVGDTVRRPMPERAAYVHDLLRLLDHYHWTGAPRYLGTDTDGREILTHLDGHVAWEPAQPPAVWSEDSLVKVTKLVRQFHDLSAGTDLAEDQEVVCHNDLAPRNTVYRREAAGLRPYAFIDWDLAAPGRRLHDVAHVCWQFLDLGPRRSSPAGPARLLALIGETYGLTTRDRGELVETIMWWQDRCWRGIAAEAAAGDPAKQRLLDSGVVEGIQDAFAWVAENRVELEAGLKLASS